MNRAELKAEILRGTAAGQTVSVPRQTFFALDWGEEQGSLLQKLGNFLAELRRECIGHGSATGAYEFFRIKR